MPSSDHVRTDANVFGTCQEIGTPLTHPGSHSGLMALRNRLGPESNKGRMISNLDEQTAHLNDPDARPWVSHPLQTVRGLMQWQVERLGER